MIAPSIAAVCASTYTYLGYAARSSSLASSLTLSSRPRTTTSNLYFLAAALTIGIAPFTVGVMMPVNNRLKAIATEAPVEVRDEKAQREEDEEVKGLLEKWNGLNAFRGVLPLVGAVVGVVAALG
jgi:hypothetical protein